MHLGQALAEDIHARFAVGAPAVVFSAREDVLHHAVTDHEAGIGWNCQSLIFEAAAVQHQRVSGAPKHSDELIHNAAARADIFVLGALADLHEFQLRHFGV